MAGKPFHEYMVVCEWRGVCDLAIFATHLRTPPLRMPGKKLSVVMTSNLVYDVALCESVRKLPLERRENHDTGFHAVRRDRRRRLVM
jgi:hypothetical protein